MKKTILLLFIAVVTLNCKNEKREVKNEETVTKENVAKNIDNDWEILFDGTSTDSWRGYMVDSIFPEWTIENGALTFTPFKEGGKNIITKKKYTNFILSLEWKISEGGNSGIFWSVFEDPKFSEAYQTGPEIQVLDNERHPDAKIAGKLHQAGALYDMIEPSEDVVKPAGEWNLCILKVDHNENLGSVTMNGVEIVTFPLHGEAWEKMIENSKFKGWDGFGEHATGHIGLQDHGDKVWFKNIKIKELK